MANIKNFSDISGEAVELKSITQMENAEFAARWPGLKGFRADSFTMWVGLPANGNVRFAGDRSDFLPITRKIEYKAFPSKHECNAKCLNGKHNGVCECKCGGKNHGSGMFRNLLEAA